MSITSYIKRLIVYVLTGIPHKHVTPSITTLAPNNYLKGRGAMITGGTSGIGFAIAKSFLQSGASVVITDRNEERLHEACSRLDTDDYPGTVHGLIMDNADVASFQGVFNQALNFLGDRPISILVNNAGILGANIATATEMEYDAVLNTNMKGTFFLSQLVGKYMKSNHIHGNILNIASSSSLRSAASAYTITKWGIRGLTLGLAKCLIPHGIVVNGIAPGPTATPMLIQESCSDIHLESSPMGRYSISEEIANMAVILTSDMGRSIVGDIVYMTGGAGLITFDDMDYTF